MALCEPLAVGGGYPVGMSLDCGLMCASGGRLVSSRTGCSLDCGLMCASGGRWWVSGRDAALIVALCEPLAVDTPPLTF